MPGPDYRPRIGVGGTNNDAAIMDAAGRVIATAWVGDAALTVSAPGILARFSDRACTRSDA